MWLCLWHHAAMHVRILILLLGVMTLSQCSSDGRETTESTAASDSAWVAVEAKVAEVTANLENFERVDHVTEAPQLRVDWEIYLSDGDVVCIIEKADMGTEGSGEITNVYERERLISRAGWERMKLADKPGGGLHEIRSRLLFDGGRVALTERTIDGAVVPFEQWQVDAFREQSEDLLGRLKREAKRKS